MSKGNLSTYKGSAAGRIYLKELAFKLLNNTKLSAEQVVRITELSRLRSSRMILEADYYIGIIETINPTTI